MKENRRHNFCEEEELCMYVNRRMCVCVFINRMVRPNRMLEKVKVNNNLAYLCIRTHPFLRLSLPGIQNPGNYEKHTLESANRYYPHDQFEKIKLLLSSCTRSHSCVTFWPLRSALLPSTALPRILSARG